MAWVNFEDIKKTVSLEMVLKHYGVELRSSGTAALRGKCPLPMHGSDKSRLSFTATLNKGTGGIWACQSRSCIEARSGKKGGNALDFVASMERCSVHDAALKLAEWFDVRSSDERGNPATKQPEKPAALISKKINGEGQEFINKPLGFELKGIDPSHPYLESRGVTAEMARSFGIGYFSGRGSMSGRIVFPIHNEKSELVAYVGRAIDESEPRYKFPIGFHKSVELYNLHRVIGAVKPPQRVVVVEGFFDCLKVSAAGFPCLALMGSSLSETQEEMIVRHFKAACLLFDGDEAGDKGREDAVKRLSCRISVYAPKLPAQKQPDTSNFDEIQNLVNMQS